MDSKCLFNKKLVVLFMLPPLILFLGLSLIPSLMTGVFSFTDIRRTSDVFQWVGLQNYREMFFFNNQRDTWAAIQRTFIFSFVVGTCQNVFGMMLALLFNSKLLKGRNFYRALVFLPNILGSSICCYSWNLMMGANGPVMILLNKLGIQSALLGDMRHAFACVMFIHIWMTVGYTMVLDIAGLQSIPTELYEAADIDGANSKNKFFKVTVPMMWSTISINILLSVIGTLGSIETILLTTGGANKTQTLGMRIYQIAFGVGSGTISEVNPTQGYAAAQSMVLFVIILSFTLLSNYITKRNGKKYEI